METDNGDTNLFSGITSGQSFHLTAEAIYQQT